ncbi:HAD-IA family hydrolase [Sphingosinicellaceae bacterium]|nr:HAD-IA family hydrolase [Sphingosinicellaceae bacterium]
MGLRALIFDVDGTLAETEEAHRAAFNQTFAEAGRDWYWSVDAYRDLLRVTGGQQRIAHFLTTIGETATPAEIATLHARKNALYADLVASGEVALRPGVARLIGEARAAGVKLGIATTTSRSNLDALLVQLLAPDAATWFDAIVAGEDVRIKKPDPEVYALTLAALGVAADEAVAIEDSRNGLVAAAACGIRTIVTPSLYSRGEDFSGAWLVCGDLDALPVTMATLAGTSPAYATSLTAQ